MDLTLLPNGCKTWESWLSPLSPSALGRVGVTPQLGKTAKLTLMIGELVSWLWKSKSERTGLDPPTPPSDPFAMSWHEQGKWFLFIPCHLWQAWELIQKLIQSVLGRVAYTLHLAQWGLMSRSWERKHGSLVLPLIYHKVVWVRKRCPHPSPTPHRLRQVGELTLRGWEQQSWPGTWLSTQESGPCTLPGNTVELILLVGARVSLPQGHELRRIGFTTPLSCGWRLGRDPSPFPIYWYLCRKT